MTVQTKTGLSCLILLLLTGCASGWQSSNYTDEFTGTKTCRVEMGTQAERDFTRGLLGGFTQTFYVENHDGEIRAGVRSEPPLPIAGDVQIKVGSRIYVLTAHDAPVDIAPSLPDGSAAAEKAMGKAYADTLRTISKEVQGMASPYRAFTGKKALSFLRDITSTGGEVKFRMVGINTITSNTASFTAGEDFKAALASCGIKL